jgi:hypothetical protein
MKQFAPAILVAILLIGCSGGGGGSPVFQNAAVGGGNSAQNHPQVPQSPSPAPSAKSAPTATPTAKADPTAPTATPSAKADPTAQPASTQAPSSQAAPSGSYSSSDYTAIVNGQAWPTVLRPYCFNSAPNPSAPCPENNTLPDNPSKLMSNSATIVANMASHNNLDVGIGGAASFDVYLASASDPTVSVSCTTWCEGSSVSIHVPSAARSEPGLCGGSGSDCGFGVIQPNGTEYDCYGITGGSNYSGGSTLSCTGLAWTSVVTGSSVDPCSQSLNYPGDGGGCVNNGQMYSAYSDSLRVSDIEAGVIPHALQVNLNCGGGGGEPAQVYPGATNATCGYAGPPAGARFQIVLTDAQIDGTASNSIGYNASNTAAWERVVLHALHDYGFYTEVTCGGGCGHSINFYTEPQEQYTQFGGTWPVSTYNWNSPGSGSGGVGSFPATWTPGGLNWQTALRIVDSCYALESCPDSPN